MGDGLERTQIFTETAGGGAVISRALQMSGDCSRHMSASASNCIDGTHDAICRAEAPERDVVWIKSRGSNYYFMVMRELLCFLSRCCSCSLLWRRMEEFDGPQRK